MEVAWSRKSPLAFDSKLGHCRQLSVGVPCKNLYLPCNHPATNGKTHQSASPRIVGADSSLHSQNTADYPAWRHLACTGISTKSSSILLFLLLLFLPHHRHYKSHIRQPLLRPFLLDPLPLQLSPPH